MLEKKEIKKKLMDFDYCEEYLMSISKKKKKKKKKKNKKEKNLFKLSFLFELATDKRKAEVSNSGS